MGLMGNVIAMRAYTKQIKGDLEGAYALYEKAAARGGFSDKNCRLGHAILLLRHGEIERAKQAFIAIAKDNSMPAVIRYNARVNLALVRWKLGDTERAIEVLENMEKDGVNTRIYESLGFLYTEKGDLDKALEYNRQAIEYDDSNAVILDNMGQTLYYLALRERLDGNGERALELMREAAPYFDRALEARKEQTASWYYKAAIARELGDEETCEEAIERGLGCSFSAMSTVTREMFEKLKAEAPTAAAPEAEQETPEE